MFEVKNITKVHLLKMLQVPKLKEKIKMNFKERPQSSLFVFKVKGVFFLRPQKHLFSLLTLGRFR